MMTHDQQARHLLRGVDLSSADYSTIVKKISEALQEAFDLGYCAAGGSVHALMQTAEGEK